MSQERSNAMMTHLRRGAVALIASGAVLAAGAGPASSGGAMVTKGEVHAFAAADGGELGIGGHATMVRTASGTTKVSLQVTGLDPGAAYKSHVHSGSCATNEAGGGHYFFAGPVGGGDGPGGDEIWPGAFVANGGGVASAKAKVHATAGEEARSVVIHRHAGPKIACADLT